MIHKNSFQHRRGLRAAALTVLLSVGAGTAGTAAAANAAGSAKSASIGVTREHKAGQPQATAAPVPVHGVADDGTPFDGTFTLQRFRARHGALYAVGQLEGQLGGQDVSRRVSFPVTGANNDAATTATPQGLSRLAAPVPTPGACSILTLNLGPLDLNLLGLRVALDPVNLLVEAIPGAGNLLGNLLCGVAGLLDGGLLGGLGGLLNNVLATIANILNGILAL